MTNISRVVALLAGVALLVASVGFGIVALDRRYWTPEKPEAGVGSPAEYRAPERRCVSCDNARPWKHASIATGISGVLVLTAVVVVSRRRRIGPDGD